MNLRDLLRQRGRLALVEALPLLRAIAGAVDAAHASRIVHRELAPENILLLRDGRVRLIRPGAGAVHERIVASEVAPGNALYLSPEQCRGTATDLRTDVYSFGALAYHVLVGEPPFAGDPLAIALHHLNDPPAPPSSRTPGLDARVDAVVLSFLAKDPDDRPHPIGPALERMLRSRRPARRWWVAGVLTVLVGGVGAAWLV